MEVLGADLKNGLLSIDLARPEPRAHRASTISHQRKRRNRIGLDRAIDQEKELRAMIPNDQCNKPIMSPEALAVLGGGKIAYVKTIRSEDVQTLFPQAPEMQPGLKLFALHAADGTPIMLTDSREAAIANAWSHELETVSVH